MKRLFLVSALVTLLTHGAEATTCSPTTFLRAKLFGTSPFPQALVTGDFNHDGLPDLAMNDSSGISVLLNDGAGGFLAPAHTELGTMPQALVAGFFDPGNTLDLAVVRDYNSIQILLGNGDGTYTAGDVYPINYGPSNLVTADFDHDGTTDLAMIAQNGNALVVLIGNGDGTFGAPVITPVSPPVFGIAAADFDGDGLADIAGSENGGVVAIFPGLGNGGFGPPSSLAVGGGLGPVLASDLDGDGHQDIVVASDQFVAIIRGNGDGTFQAAVESPVGYAASALAVADVDGDGRSDVAALRGTYGPGAGIVSVLHQRVDGFFEDGGSYDVGPGASGLAAGDFDGDGESDLATVNLGAPSVSVLFALGGGNLEAAQRVPADGNLIAVAVADFAGDSRQDIAVLAAGPAVTVSVLARDANDRYQTLGSTAIPGNPFGMAAGRFVPNSHGDLIVTDYYNGFSVLVGRGDGTFASPVDYAPGVGMTFVTVADFNGDGIPDVIAVEQSPYPTGTLAVFLGVGDGTFTEGPTTPLHFQPYGLVAVDVDGDGRMDVATANGYSDDSISIYRGFRIGFFDPIEFPAGPQPIALAAGSFANGNAVDFIVADAGASIAALLRPGGSGYLPPEFIGVGAAPTQVITGDFDGDGHLDFVTASGQGGILSLLRGNGDFTFQFPQVYSVESNPIALAAGALGGSRLDVVVGSAYNPSSITIFQNTGVSGLIVPPPPTLVGNPISIGVLASGFGPLGYQWLQDGLPISDGVPFSGATTPVLTINPVSFPDAASTYSVAITDSCGVAVVFAPPLDVEFADVPTTNIFHDDIITIATRGVTAGCGGSNYCPTALVSRAQMAAFLLKSEHGSTYVPPTCVGVFADVPCPSPFADWIEQLANENVTAGCGGDNYCPDASVTRAQMAVFLLKTSQGSGYAPPPAVGIFGDVPVGSFGADYIEDLYNRGITGGCSASPLLYCPDSTVNRGQMAVFLVNTFFGP